jgi:hypothetical protein
MWTAAPFVLVGVTVAFGAWTYGCSRQPEGRLTLALYALIAGVLWPVLLIGVAEIALISGVLASLRWLARHDAHEPLAVPAHLDEEEPVPV